MIYGSKYDVSIKETCFEVIINGEGNVIESLVEEIRALDPSGIFIKNRGYPQEIPGEKMIEAIIKRQAIKKELSCRICKIDGLRCHA